MIFWRRSERRRFTTAIRGFFGLSHVTATEDVVDTPDCFLAVSSIISTAGLGAAGIVSAQAVAGVGVISPILSRASSVDETGLSLSGTITPDGLSVGSEIQPTFGINGNLCC